MAGHETTANLIASGTLALLTHPAELARLRSEPGLLPGAVEELPGHAAVAPSSLIHGLEKLPVRLG